MSAQPPPGPDWSRPGGDPPPGTRWPEERQADSGSGSARGSGRRAARVAAGVAGLVAVAALGATGGAWLAHRGKAPAAAPLSTAPATPTVTASPSSSPSASAGPRKQPLSAVAQVDAASARTRAKQAGIPVLGRAVEAWTWTDTNGGNLLLTTRSVDEADGEVVRAATVRVYHVARFDTSPKLLRAPLRDPGVSDCDVDFTLDFVPGSVKVTDTDGDGYGEASVGYAYLCAGDPQPPAVKLALLTKGTYFILRGQGQRASDPAPPAGSTFPKASFTPNVPGSRWPPGTYQQTVALFRTLFR